MPEKDSLDKLKFLPAYQQYKLGSSALKTLLKTLHAGRKLTTPDIAAGVGKSAYKSLDQIQSLLAAASDYGVKKAKGKPTKFKEVVAKKPTFFDVVGNVPSEYNVKDVVRSVPGITGKYTPSEEDAAKIQALWERFQKTGVPKALHPIFRTVLEGGEKSLPIGQIQKGISQAGGLISRSTPVGKTATDLARLLKIEPKIDESKRISSADILKPVAGFGLDVATHPITAIAGGGGLALKGIKAAAKSGTIGKETFGAFGEAYPRVAQMINELFKGKDPEKIYAALRNPSKLLSPKFQEAIMKSQRDISRFGEYATVRTRAWANIKNPEARKVVGEAVLKNDYSLLDPFKKQFPEIEKVAKDFRRLITKAGRQAVKAGKVSEETFVKNKDTYARQMFEYFENPEAFVAAHPEAGLTKMLTDKPIAGGSTSVSKVAEKLFKPRTATEEVKQRLGVLGPEHIGFTAGEGSVRTYRSARNAKMFQELAASPELVKPRLPDEILGKFTGKNIFKQEQAAIRQADKVRINMFTDVPMIKIGDKQWIKMPDNLGFGAIKNKWLPRWDAESIIGSFSEKNKILQSYDKLLGLWKSGKVVMSTAAQGRNLMSNTLLMVYSGIPMGKAIKYLGEASSSIAKKGDMDAISRAFIRYGGRGTTFAEQETMRLGSKFTGVEAQSAAMTEFKDIANIPGKVYSGTENIFKNAVMRYWNKEKGLSSKAAFDKAQETLFNYADISNFLKGVRRTAIPFVTFFAKALPFTAKSVLKRPASVLPMLAAKDVLNDHNAKKIGLTSKDINLLHKRYGDWYLIVGGTKQKPDVMDLSYIIPGLSDMTGYSGSRGILGESPIPQSLQPSTPLLTALEVLPGINKSFYFDKPITKETDIKLSDIGKGIDELVKKGMSRTEAIKQVLASSGIGKRASYMAKALLPANVLVPGSYQFNQLKAALQGTPAYTSGDVPKIETAIASTVGLKTSPVNLLKSQQIAVNKNKQNRKKLIGELIQVNASKLSEKEKFLRRKVIMLKYKQQLESLKKQMKTGRSK